ncbi:Uncharacterized protein conserved in bacteria [Megamonas hypermegale ART12/1]|nr:Uncharacterized protein conserved in bacteria [Megamonas hypermegale ART12/1]
MAKDSSFDIVSQVDMQEMSNAVNQTEKEISQRYDFRGSIASIELEDKAIKIAAEDDYKLNAIIDILRARMAKKRFIFTFFRTWQNRRCSKRFCSSNAHY